uniref:Uncharacterized protein n=1 Tax=Vitis vinifera TaxID=29760 RepID=A5BV60_VITVI|nr:hypothetical protein VITISV_024071 [Vitis vinifera]
MQIRNSSTRKMEGNDIRLVKWWSDWEMGFRGARSRPSYSHYALMPTLMWLLKPVACADWCLLLRNQRRPDIGCVLVLDAAEIEGISEVAAALELRTRLGFTGFGFHSIPRPMVSIPRNEGVNESSHRGKSSKLNLAVLLTPIRLFLYLKFFIQRLIK